MKLTKSRLQQIIKEEIEKLVEDEEDLEENKQELDEEQEELEEYEIGDIRSSEIRRATGEPDPRERERKRERERRDRDRAQDDSAYGKSTRTGRGSSGRYSFEESKQRKPRKRRKK